MAESLQPMSHSQQLVSDLIKKLRHSFSMEATDQLVSKNEFNNAFIRVFTGVPTAKFRQIFISFDEENQGTLNWYQFLKSEQLPKILLALHDQSISQITMLQHEQHSHSFSDGTINTTDVENENENDNITMPVFPTPHNTLNTRSSYEFDFSKHSSIALKSPIMTPHISNEESMASLEHEVQERDVEIHKLKQWITITGLPGQKSISNLKQKVSKASQRERAMADEIKNLQHQSESLNTQNITLQKEKQQVETQYVALQNEHKTLKNYSSEIQRDKDETTALYNKQKNETVGLNKQITDLTNLKNKYETVNNDQQNKIEQLKQDKNDFRGKIELLEMYCQDITADNEQLNQYISTNIANTNELNEQSKDNQQTAEVNAAIRARSLSAVNEDTECSLAKLSNINANAEKIQQPQHRNAAFNRSVQFNVHTFDQLARRFSAVTPTGKGKRGSLLGKIRAFQSDNITPTGSASEYLDPQMPYIHSINHSINDSGMTPRILQDLDSTDSTVSNNTVNTGKVGGYRRRKRGKTISIISINSMLSNRKRATSFNSPPDNVSNDGYADQMFEELGDDMDNLDTYDNDMDSMGFDQLQELTEQLEGELKEEMEEELEKKAASKYELKMMKVEQDHKDELNKLKKDMQRLRHVNHKQARQLKIIQGNGMQYNINDDHDQKTNENDKKKRNRVKLGDDMDDFNSNSVTFHSDGDVTYDDDDKSESETESSNSYDASRDDLMDMEMLSEEESEYIQGVNNDKETAPLLGGEDISNSKQKKRKKKKKKGKKSKKKTKKVKREHAIKRSGFCCSSIFADVGKSVVDSDMSGMSDSAGHVAEASQKYEHEKKKKKRKKKKGKKEKKDKKSKKEKKERKKSKSKKKKRKSKNKKYTNE